MSGTLETVQSADQNAFAPPSNVSGASVANGMINRSGMRIASTRMRGRASAINPAGRFETSSRHLFDDGWQTLDELPPFKTDVTAENPRSIIARNESPDLPFDRSINPYRGCEHGCVYCFARPTHSYMGLSAGLDFETKLFAKPNAAKLLRKELASPNYEVKSMAMGTNTDPYQPIEKQWRVTREILEVLEDSNHPVGIVMASLLFGALYQGGVELDFEFKSITREMVLVIQGLIILFSGALAYMFTPWLARVFVRRAASA